MENPFFFSLIIHFFSGILSSLAWTQLGIRGVFSGGLGRDTTGGSQKAWPAWSCRWRPGGTPGARHKALGFHHVDTRVEICMVTASGWSWPRGGHDLRVVTTPRWSWPQDGRPANIVNHKYPDKGRGTSSRRLLTLGRVGWPLRMVPSSLQGPTTLGDSSGHPSPAAT